VLWWRAVGGDGRLLSVAGLQHGLGDMYVHSNKQLDLEHPSTAGTCMQRVCQELRPAAACNSGLMAAGCRCLVICASQQSLGATFYLPGFSMPKCML